MRTLYRANILAGILSAQFIICAAVFFLSLFIAFIGITYISFSRFFFVFAASLPDSPLATFVPHDQYVELGSEARFYCEAFVGSIRLPDSKNFISWYQVFDDGVEQNIETQELIRR